LINIACDVWSYLGDLLGILGRNSINPKSLFVVAGIIPFQLSALFAASKKNKRSGGIIAIYTLFVV
jgi:hypothetical protein